MVALAVTVIAGVAVVVDNDAPPAHRILAACTSDAAASLVLLALQGLQETDPELLAVPLASGDGWQLVEQVLDLPVDHPVGPTSMVGPRTTIGGAEHMRSAQPLVYDRVQRLRGLAPLADAASVAAHFGIAVDLVEAIWAERPSLRLVGVTAPDDDDGGPRAA